MTGRIDAVLFDFDHTLGIAHLVEEHVLQRLSGKYGLPVPSVEAMSAALNRFRAGQETLDEMLDGVFGSVMPGAAIEAEYKRDTLRALPSALVPMPGVAEMLEAFRDRSTPIAILTNGWTEYQMAKAAMIGFPGPVYASEEIGLWKPDKRAFCYAVDGLGAVPATTLFVGDTPQSDVAGAKAAGLQAAWADFEGKRYPDDVVRPDFVIHALTELPAIVDAVGKAS
ncbi:MAG TPA: HAD family hydrolase [Candidatus Eremiobacteraceae bacterium]|nr:HAD family hydrolase [Candidatus Eremiobacteraceae bacterium]